MSVNSLFQDDQGFIWVSTHTGLAKYDGYNFEVFSGSQKDTSGENPSGRFFDEIIQGKDGTIWIGTHFSGGLTSFNPNTEKFTNYYNTKDEITGLHFADFIPIMEDSKGRIWLKTIDRASNSNRLERFDPATESFSHYPIKPSWNSSFGFSFFAIDEDSKGNVYVAESTTGIYKMAATSTELELVYPIDLLSKNKQARNQLHHIMVDSEDRLWASTNQGLSVIDLSTQQVSKHVHVTSDPTSIANDTVGMSYQDLKGQIWVSTRRGTLNQFKEDTNTFQRIDLNQDQIGLPKEITNAEGTFPIAENEDGIWFFVANPNGPLYFLYYDHDTRKFTKYNDRFNNPNNQSNHYPTTAIIDRSGLLWLGNNDVGINRQNPTADRVQRFYHDPEDSRSLPNDTIYSLLEDRKGAIWITTQNGMSKFYPEENRFESFYLSGDETKFSKVLEDDRGKVWVGSVNGLHHIDVQSNQLQMVFERKGGVTPLLTDTDGNIWLSYQGTGGIGIFNPTTKVIVKEYFYNKEDTTSIQSNTILFMLEDHKDRVWLGSARGLSRFNRNEDNFTRYQSNPDDSTSLSDNRILFMMEDSEERLWIGTNVAGLNLYVEETDSFRNWKDPDTFLTIFTGIEDKNGTLWFGTWGTGLYKFDPKSEAMTRYTEKDGLMGNTVPMIIEDDYGNLFLPTDKGLSHFEVATEVFENFAEDDGYQSFLPWVEYIKPLLKTRNGDVWIAGLNGLHHIQPQKLIDANTLPPEVLITSLQIDDQIFAAADGNILSQHISQSESISLSHEQNDLIFSYVGLDYARPQENHYSYFLENFDKDWSTPSTEREVRYSNLSPGTYTFSVKASNADGVWNYTGKSLQVVIKPPWWRTWWAYLLYLSILAFLIWFIIKKQKEEAVRVEKEKNKDRELAQAKEIEKAYAELKATQVQLIQSEKMASLGELTAGIAHEIQNPLNFVKNFSEVSTELIDEMNEEIENGDLDEIKALSADLKQNLKIIAHHGTRASSIVKGMLDHSRASTGEKISTDINALCDECLRLSFHGLRAKDKSFNAEYETNFDDSLPEIKVMSQEIGRVFLNIINNAFYAVDQKRRSSPSDHYKPKVSISSTKVKDHIEICIKDNGIGMSKETFEKIYQPFFTTKPSGEGTGLGLSISYDIITKGHGGELKVESIEGEGSTFTILLPLSN